MRILYFSRGYTPHDYRFLSSLAKTKHEIFFVQLEAPRRQTEDRPVPKNIRQILWAGGKHEFRWRDLPRLTFDFLRPVPIAVAADLCLEALDELRLRRDRLNVHRSTLCGGAMDVRPPVARRRVSRALSPRLGARCSRPPPPAACCWRKS